MQALRNPMAVTGSKECSWSAAQHGCLLEDLEPAICQRCNKGTVHHLCAIKNIDDPDDQLAVHQTRMCLGCSTADPQISVLSGTALCRLVMSWDDLQKKFVAP